MAERLYQRATGYSHLEDKVFNDNGKPLIVPTIKHYPPEVKAAIFWLKNRKSLTWRDKKEIDQSGELHVTVIDSFGKSNIKATSGPEDA